MKKILFLLLLTFIIVFADGIIIHPDSFMTIQSRGQIALIKHFEGVEELYILLKTGDYYYQNLAWVIPLPSLPQVDTIGSTLFEDLAEISKPVYQNRPYYYDFSCSGAPEPNTGISRDYYTIIQYSKLYDFLSTTVIHTNQIDTLTNWLITNGYHISNQTRSLLLGYINKNWTYFFCAKTIPGSNYPNTFAIKLVFDSDEPVFPMKISKANLPYGYHDLFVYVITDNKMTFAGSTLMYANKITNNELAEINRDFPALGALLKQGDFLTKLHKQYQNQNDFADITLTQASDNKEYRELYGEYYYYYGFNLSFLPIGFLYFIFLKGYHFLKRRKLIKR